MTQWFANRGQVIQIAIAAVALAVGAAVGWKAAPIELSIIGQGAAILAFCFMLFSLGRVFGRGEKAKRPAIAEEEQGVARNTREVSLDHQMAQEGFGPPIPPVTSHQVQNREHLTHSYTGFTKISTIQIAVGDRWTFPQGDISLEVRAIRSYRRSWLDESVHGAEIVLHGSATFSSESFEVNGGGRLILPQRRFGRTWAAYWCYFDDDGVTSWAVALDHANPHSGLATLTIMWARGHPTSSTDE